MVATIDSLANETLARIFELIRGPLLNLDTVAFNRAEWQAVTAPLLAASLVCRRWRDSAQRALNTKLIFPRGEQWLASPAFGRFRVRSVALSECHHVEEIGKVLEACPGLEQVAMFSQAHDSLTLPWEFLRFPSLRELSTLVLRYFESFEDLCATFGPLPFHHTYLSLWLFGSGLPAVAALHTLFISSTTTLSTLRLRFENDYSQRMVDLANPSFNLVVPRLRPLTIEPDSGEHSALLDLAQCGSLESLSISGDEPGEPADNSEGLAATVRTLPPSPTLRRLSLSALSAEPLHTLYPLLFLSSLSLTQLNLPSLLRSESRDLWRWHDASRNSVAAMWKECEDLLIRVTFDGEE